MEKIYNRSGTTKMIVSTIAIIGKNYFMLTHIELRL